MQIARINMPISFLLNSIFAALQFAISTNRVCSCKTSLSSIVVISGLLVGSILPINAQDSVVLSLESDTTSLQTGQEYEVRVRIQDITNFWSMGLNIGYDPSLLYVMGTASGSPIQPGEMLAGQSITVIRNTVRPTLIDYGMSLLPPSEPVTGTGTLLVFRIYPIAPGTTEIRFNRGQLVSLEFGDSGSAGDFDTVEVPFTAVLLQLTITGDAVPVPSEATATPTLTPTRSTINRGGEETAEPTLLNVTAVPQSATTPAATDSPEADNTSILLIAVVLVVVGAVGLIALVVYARRR